MAEKKWYENLDDAIITKKSDVSPKVNKKRSTAEFAGDTGRALAQGLTFGTADEMEAGARALYAKFIEGKDFNTAYNETVKEIRSDISQFREDNPKTAYGTEIAGNLPSGIFATAKLAKLGFTPMKNLITQGSIYGAGTGEGNPVERVPDAVTGGAISGTIGKALPPITDKAKELIGQGIPLTVGQSVGGGIRKIEEGLKSIPFLGDAIVGAEIRATQGFNKATFKKVLEPLEKYGVDLKKALKKETTGNELYKEASNIISKGYEKLKPKLKFPNRDELQSVYDDVILRQADVMPKSVNNKFLQDMDEIVYKNFSPDGSLSGSGFKNIQSGLRTIVRGYSNSTDQVTRNYANSYNKVLEALNNTLVKNNPKYADELTALDFSFKMLNTVGKAVEKGSNRQGTFTPANLMSAVRSSDDSLRKSDVRKGEALLQDMALDGQNINLTLPDSGTASRQLITGGLLNLGGGTAGIDPFITGGLTGGIIGGYSKVGVPSVRTLYDRGLPAMRNVLTGNVTDNFAPDIGMNRR
tara:strand:+ start:888 stop:2465 length:1578 start_codon:yes stop_codon:yes gene_type:complete